jgi:ubiquitin C-terminal hydrolase
MSSTQLHSLWQLCSAPPDREELMIFIASASSSGINAQNPAVVDQPVPAPQQQQLNPQQQQQQQPLDDSVSPAFTDEVCAAAFLDLFCSPSISFEFLGEGAYKSFHFMFNKLRLLPATGRESTDAALDALWRICLRSGNDAVATQAMKDLMAVYIANTTTIENNNNTNGWAGGGKALIGSAAEPMQTDNSDESFGKRVFDCLANVKRGLEAGDASAELAAERCLRILNAAIGQIGTGGSSITPSTLKRLACLPSLSGLRDTVNVLPHGMRGQACYRKVGVMAKRTAMHGQQGPQPQQQTFGGRDESSTGSSNQPRNNSTTMRFSLDVHPLETLLSVKSKVAAYCQCPLTSVKPISVSGRLAGTGNRSQSSDSSQMSLNVVPDDSVVDELGIVEGCEIVFVIAERQTQQTPNAAAAASSKATRNARSRDLSDIFVNDSNGFADKLFQTLLAVLQALPWIELDAMADASAPPVDTHQLVWDLLLAMPTNAAVASRVRVSAGGGDISRSPASDDDAMEIDLRQEQWSNLLDLRSFHRSVYVLLAIDAFLQPAVEVLSSLPTEHAMILERETKDNAVAFRRGFIESGGFDAVVRFFSSSENDLEMRPSKTRMANAVALRILKCCLFGNSHLARPQKGASANLLDEAGNRLLQSLTDTDGLLRSLTSMVVGDGGISTSTISDVLKFLRLLFRSPQTAQSFVSLSDGMAEKFLITLLLWEGGSDSTRPSSSVGAASKVRRNTHDLILMTPILADHALPWLIRAIDMIPVVSDSTSEYFDVLKKLVADERSTARSRNTSHNELNALATAVCKKISSCPRPTTETAMIDFSTGVLCGCLALLRALIENGGGSVLIEGTSILVNDLGVTLWSEMLGSSNNLISSLRTRPRAEDLALIDLMGVIFDAFLSPGGSSSVVAICCDKESRQHGFDVVGAAARSCAGGDGYLALVTRINGLVSSAAPYLRHRWGQVGGGNDGHSRSGRNTSKYSGLRNQGCTCYMNSFLQQLFMMPELRKSICSAPLPACVRSSGGVVSTKGGELVGKKVAMQWDNGVSYDAIVEGFDEDTGMHTIRYCPVQVASVSGSGHQQVQPEDIARLPPLLQEELFLSEGRPGKETGAFEIVSSATEDTAPGSGEEQQASACKVEESEDESSSRHLMEEVQRTLIHLDEGSRGRCFDPRALVEACACLKLEFDVWQQNDASEFATKLLDRLETSLKRWAPENFRYLDHTFGLKQTKQKICKECGLKVSSIDNAMVTLGVKVNISNHFIRITSSLQSNREEKLLNVDCQIRGKADIHEALGTMTELEIMEGNNQVFCDRCKKNTDTVLRTAISSLPNMLILSLKRFDLDYNTFETVKLNSRCAFGQTLNMKRYTLEGLEAMENAGKGDQDGGPAPMDTGCADSPDESAMSHLPDADYEYKLAGVLVHAGVAQGGHYYSFIKDRNPGSEEKWYRFDDEDVTPFDPVSIETECFGGKIKKESKWPNGQVHITENEQYANALMLFYEKVKPSDVPEETESKDEKKDETKPLPIETIPKNLEMTSGYDVFEPDVRRSNATHRWQTFLFDGEFQTFLKGLLGLCRLANSESDRMGTSPSISSPSDNTESESSWRASVVQMLLSFVFDILLYSTERTALGDWVRMLEETLEADQICARNFVHKLALKTKDCSASWLRTYLSDCPDHVSRNAAVRIFTAAYQSCISSEEEQRELGSWLQAWMDQLTYVGVSAAPLPYRLEEKWQIHEDLQAAGGAGASSPGVILSYLNVLLEASPRNWRHSPELCLFIRNLASLDPSRGGEILRRAMIESLIPARLTCLVTRERAPAALRAAFPGASVAVDVAETQMRVEQNPAHMMSLSGSQALNPPDMNFRGGGSPMDHVPLFEALGCLLGLRGVIHAPLVIEVEETVRGRQRVALSDQAVAALQDVFEEACAPNSIGMGQREIEIYLARCGVDSASVPTQKIVDIMAKYPTTPGGNGSKGSNYLSLDGFLAYYRDTAQTNEARVSTILLLCIFPLALLECN